MALPTTNLTFHVDAATTAGLWKDYDPYANHPADGEHVGGWEDVDKTNVQAVSNGIYTTFGAIYQSTTPLMLNPCMYFNGSVYNHFMATDTGATSALSNFITNLAFTMFFAIYPQGIATNAAASYDNDCIICEQGGNLGIHLKNAADPRVLFYQWDGNEDVLSLPITLNASHILMYRHQSGSIYGSVDNGTESSALSGTTGGLSYGLIGKSYTGTSFYYNGRIGEIAIYNAALTGTPFTDAMSYFMAKWVTVAAASEVEIHRTALCTPVRIG